MILGAGGRSGGAAGQVVKTLRCGGTPGTGALYRSRRSGAGPGGRRIRGAEAVCRGGSLLGGPALLIQLRPPHEAWANSCQLPTSAGWTTDRHMSLCVSVCVCGGGGG